MEFKLIELKLDECTTSDETFNVFTKEESAPLSDLPAHPLLVMKNEENYTLIYGEHEYEQLREAKRKLPAYILPSNLEFKELFYQVINYHQQRRVLNHFEVSNIVNMLLQKKYSLSEIADNFAKLLNIAPTRKIIKNYLSLQKINSIIVKFLITKNAPLKKWLLFAKIAPESQNFLVKIINKLNPSLTVSTQLTRNIFEIAKRENHKTMDVINNLKLPEILKKEAQKIALQRIREIVKNARYPVLEKHKKEIADAVDLLKLPQNIKIIPDKTMETKNYRIQIKIKSESEIEQAFDYLKKNSENLEELFKKL